MVATPEGKVKKKIKEILGWCHIYWFMPQGGYYGNIGVPDFICCVNGRFVAIEAKAGNREPTVRQFQHLQDIKAHGGCALVINEKNVDNLRKLLDDCLQQSESD